MARTKKVVQLEIDLTNLLFQLRNADHLTFSNPGSPHTWNVQPMYRWSGSGRGDTPVKVKVEKDLVVGTSYGRITPNGYNRILNPKGYKSFRDIFKAALASRAADIGKVTIEELDEFYKKSWVSLIDGTRKYMKYYEARVNKQQKYILDAETVLAAELP